MSRRIFLTLVFLFLKECDNWRGMDNIETLSEQPSSNGRFAATILYCEAGGAAGYTYNNASLRREGDTLNQGNARLGKHKTWSGFSDIEIRWIDDSNLEISYTQNSLPEQGLGTLHLRKSRGRLGLGGGSPAARSPES